MTFEPYVAFAVIFLALDMAWFALVGGRFYKSQLGALMREKIGWPAAGIFYLVNVAVIGTLAIAPAAGLHDAAYAAWVGGLIGAASYCAYNLTNLATLRNWPKALVVVDTIWGVSATTIASWLSVLVLNNWI